MAYLDKVFHHLKACQLRFIKEYMACLNGTRAAIRAGYSPKSARAIASENLQKPEIAAEVQKLEDAQRPFAR